MNAARAIAGEAIPTPAQLEYMAFHGESERVHAIFKRIPRSEWNRYANRYVLSQALHGGVAKLGSAAWEAAVVIEEERDFLEEVVTFFVSVCRSQGTFPRELLRSLLEWSRELLAASRLVEALRYCDLAVDLGAKAFSDLYPQLLLHKANVLSARGEVAEAHSTLRSLYERMDLVADRNLVSRLTLDLAKTSLLTGQVRFFKRLLFDGLKVFYKNLDDRRTILDLIRRTYRRSFRVFVSGDPRPGDKLVFLVHWLCLGFPARLATRVLAYPMERGLLVGVYLAQYAQKGRKPLPALGPVARSREQRFLVTRAMGGVGDLLMMTPGLHALRRRHPEARIQLAVPRRFFPLFEGNDDVELLDIHTDLDPKGYDRWFNLTDCPAARTESLTAPSVRRNRIEIFARALGIRGLSLWRMERRPRYFLSAEDRSYRERFFAAAGLQDRVVIGFQVRSDETYRDYPHMAALIQAVSRRHAVLLFDSRPIAGYDFANAIKADGRGLREAAALASGCDALVAPDSSFVHIAAALDLPAIGLFGPTDGAVRTRDYPGVRFIDARADLRCIPCWRNEEIPCALTGMRTSVCLGEISAVSVAAALEDLLSETGRGGARRDGGRSH